MLTLATSPRHLTATALAAALVFAPVPASAELAEPAAPVEPAAGAVEAVGSSTDDTSGVLVPEAEPPRAAARSLLLVPRAAAAGIAAPLRGGLTLYEEHHLYERIVDVLFDDTRTYGVYPAVAFETSLPVAAGLRFVHRNLFGAGGRLRLGASYGGEARHRLDGTMTSPAFAGGILRARVLGGWQRQPRAVFFGIGDGDLGRSDDTMAGLPARSPLAYATRFRQDVVQGDLGLEIDPAGPLFAAVSTGYFGRGFGDGEMAPPAGDLDRTDIRYDTGTLTGWQQGTRVSYSEVSLGWDSLVSAGPFVSAATPSSGTKAVLFAGIARDVGGGTVSYTRHGLDVLRYIDLYNGDRVLILRGRIEGVAGTGDGVPFTDLPRLGGPSLLRGYARDRFRDRISLLASVEYRYPIGRLLAGYLFVDGGRVRPDLASAGNVLREPQHLRLGGGGGLEILQQDRFRLRGQVAGSPEGFFIQLALEPVYRLPTHHHRI
jgi:hypothetical protein